MPSKSVFGFDSRASDLVKIVGFVFSIVKRYFLKVMCVLDFLIKIACRAFGAVIRAFPTHLYHPNRYYRKLFELRGIGL